MREFAQTQKPATRASFAHPLKSKSIRIQPKLKIGAAGDAYEQEADRVADQVMRMPEPGVQRKCACGGGCPSCQSEQDTHAHVQTKSVQTKSVQANDVAGIAAPPIVHDVLNSPGQPLDAATRAFMEPRFGHDFGHVRVHADARAADSAAAIGARAFTVGSDIVLGAGEYAPQVFSGRQLLSHELTHTVQQTSKDQAAASPKGEIQRKLEFRPPGKGEASAFDRAQELVDRLNTISPAIQYELKGQELTYVVKDAAALTLFDTKMKGFIDQADTVPMRLITSKGYLGGDPIFADDFVTAYVDLDDLLADDIYSFQSDLLHFLTERFQVKGYARLIGTDFSAQFEKAHQAGKDAEAAQLQDLFKDLSIVFNYEESKPNNTWVNAFKSKDHGYRVFQVVKHHTRETAGGEMWVQKKDGTRVSMEDFKKERAAVP